MYQSKESERDVSESDGEGGPRAEGKEEWVPERARAACTRCALDSGTSQSGRDCGTSVYT